MLAQAAIPGAVLWPLLLGAAVTLVSTVVAQWSSLAYQTRRLREARRADFQRSTLIQIRDELLALTEATRTVEVVPRSVGFEVGSSPEHLT